MAPQTSITVHFQSRLNLSFTNNIPMYPPWNNRHPKNKQRKVNQSSLKVKARAMLETIWESDKEKRDCLVYLRTKRKTQSRSPSLLDYQCNKERNPRKYRKDLRSPRTSITHYPGGKNTIQKSVWNPNSMGLKTSPGTRNQLANLGNQSSREGRGTKKHCPAPKSDHQHQHPRLWWREQPRRVNSS